MKGVKRWRREQTSGFNWIYCGGTAMQGTVSREAEMEYLKEFARQGCFDEELGRDQLRCLWTAYCLHHGLDADTSGYDNDLLELWDATAEDEDETADWSDHDSFEDFMCRYLV